MAGNSRGRHGPITLTDFLGADESMARLTAHASRLLLLQQQFEASAPRQLTAHARVANYRLGKIIVHANSSAVAAKLRQLGPSLLVIFQNSGCEVTEIEVKVQPGLRTKPGLTPDSEKNLGTKARQGLAEFSQKLPAGDRLRRALEGLLRRARTPDGGGD